MYWQLSIFIDISHSLCTIYIYIINYNIIIYIYNCIYITLRSFLSSSKLTLSHFCWVETLEFTAWYQNIVFHVKFSHEINWIRKESVHKKNDGLNTPSSSSDVNLFYLISSVYPEFLSNFTHFHLKRPLYPQVDSGINTNISMKGIETSNSPFVALKQLIQNMFITKATWISAEFDFFYTSFPHQLSPSTFYCVPSFKCNLS